MDGVVDVGALCTVTGVPLAVDEEPKCESPEYAAVIECGFPNVE
jgi:hypothetical protein